MHTLLLLSLLIGAAFLAACGTCPCMPGSGGDSEIERAAARHDWTWFGKTESEAAAAAEKAGGMFRVVVRDGQPQPTTRDHRPGRINATVHEGRVIHVAVEDETTVEGATEADMVFVLGHSEEDALAAAKTADRRCRVIDRGDGKSIAVTMDHDPTRLNLILKDGVVIAVRGG